MILLSVVASEFVWWSSCLL